VFRFEHPEYLMLLAIIPLWWLGTYLVDKISARNLAKVGEVALVQKMMEGHSSRRILYKRLLFILGLLFLVMALSNPQWGVKRKKIKAKGADIMLALDISRSMLAEDIPPSRLERAKKITEKLIDQFKGERVGLILFAGNAYLQMPLTNDYAAAKLFTRSASTDQATSQGTAISDAIYLAEQLFSDKEKYHRALIIISDGENHDEDAITTAKRAHDEQGLVIFTVGVGTTQGAFIPIVQGGRETYISDRSGQYIKTKINETLLSDIAEQADGSYFHISQYKPLMAALDKKIAQLDRRDLEHASFDEYNSYFQYFLALALTFLLLSFWWPEKVRNKKELSIQ